MQSGDKNVVLIALSNAYSSEQIAGLQKILSAFTSTQLFDKNQSTKNFENYDYIFTDKIEMLNGPSPKKQFIFITKSAEENIGLVRDGISIWQYQDANGESTRLLYNFIYPEKSLGAAGLVEKGSTIFIEKIQEIAGIGRTIDHISSFALDNNLECTQRIFDIHQAISCAVHASIKHEKQAGNPYPTCDLQIQISSQKFVFATRFRSANEKQNEIILEVKENKYSLWRQIFLSCDQLFITFTKNEIELRGIVYSKKSSKGIFISKIEKLNGYKILSAPKNYPVVLISDMPLHRMQKTVFQVSMDKDEAEEENHEGFKVKLEKTTQEKNHLAETLKNKEVQVKNLMASLNKARLELTTSKNIIIKLNKEKNSSSSHQNINSQKQMIADKAGGKSALELSAEIADIKKKFAKEYEKEKNNNIQQQKKILILEQKINSQGKELMAKENNINTLKQALDAKKEREQASATTVSNKQNENKEQKQDLSQIKTLLIRIKDLESNENKLKQEIKKLNFQIENNKKSSDVKKDGASDKIRIIEKKLEEAKQKEIELLKKIESLTHSLKRFTRAA